MPETSPTVSAANSIAITTETHFFDDLRATTGWRAGK
jgi:hypothetical protein